MTRFVLRFKGPGPAPKEDIEKILALPDVQIIEKTSRMLLVDAPDMHLGVFAQLPSWLAVPESSIGLPVPPRPVVREKIS